MIATLKIGQRVRWQIWILILSYMLNPIDYCLPLEPFLIRFIDRSQLLTLCSIYVSFHGRYRRSRDMSMAFVTEIIFVGRPQIAGPYGEYKTDWGRIVPCSP
jgi:hypothetical protein